MSRRPASSTTPRPPEPDAGPGPIISGPEHRDRGREHHAEIPAGVFEERHDRPAATDLPRQDHFRTLPPALRHHHMADARRRIDAAGDAGEHDPVDGRTARRQLRGHRRVDDTDPARRQQCTAPVRPAGREVHAVCPMLRLALQFRQRCNLAGGSPETRHFPDGPRRNFAGTGPEHLAQDLDSNMRMLLSAA